ncbi:MAG: hypothetical protein HJJLKODD_01117 [Phycisphaerae bacterium]|nr:hypothetical protein [Phycisphaerae bacterium]
MDPISSEASPSPTFTPDLSGWEALIPQVYDELRALAAHFLQRERRDHTLQPTALAHEAYLKLIRYTPTAVPDRQDFFIVASATIRRILINHAHHRRTLKRGGEANRLELTEQIMPADTTTDELLALNDALEQLATEDQTLAQLVELRFFAGLQTEEIANLLGISSRTVERRWNFARAWLRRHLCTGEGHAQ